MRLPPAPSSIALVAVVAVGALAGCGSDTRAAQLRPWVSEVLYLPPPPPPTAGDAAAPAATRAARTAPRRTVTTAPASPADPRISSGAPSDAQIAAELRQGFKNTSRGSDIVDAASVNLQGLASVPPSAPSKVVAMITAANQVARKPYVYGGGHGGGPEGLFIDSAYDCSGSVSFALASAGFIDSPMDSSSLARFGKAGPGKWVTIYANAGHAFMVVAGLRFDTVGRAQAGTRWQAAPRSVSGFTVRHPPGL